MELWAQRHRQPHLPRWDPRHVKLPAYTRDCMSRVLSKSKQNRDTTTSYQGAAHAKKDDSTTDRLGCYSGR